MPFTHLHAIYDPQENCSDDSTSPAGERLDMVSDRTRHHTGFVTELDY